MARFISILFLSSVLIACNSNSNSPTNPVDTSSTPSEQTASSSSGRELFQRNCTSCHLVDRKLIGPPLKDADKRWTDKQKLYDYIHNPADYIANANDERVKKLHEEYQIVMPSFPYLKEAEIDSIFNFIKEQSAK